MKSKNPVTKKKAKKIVSEYFWVWMNNDEEFTVHASNEEPGADSAGNYDSGSAIYCIDGWDDIAGIKLEPGVKYLVRIHVKKSVVTVFEEKVTEHEEGDE